MLLAEVSAESLASIKLGWLCPRNWVGRTLPARAKRTLSAGKPKGFTYTDRPPGEYRIETKTEVARHVDVPLDAGQTKYIRLDPTMGVMIGRIIPKLIDNPKAESEIRACHFMGNAPTETAANP